MIDGWSLLEIIEERGQPGLKTIPVHIISAFDDSRLHTNWGIGLCKNQLTKEGLEKAFITIEIYLFE
jgi:hypothetical protein